MCLPDLSRAAQWRDGRGWRAGGAKPGCKLPAALAADELPRWERRAARRGKRPPAWPITIRIGPLSPARCGRGVSPVRIAAQQRKGPGKQSTAVSEAQVERQRRPQAGTEAPVLPQIAASDRSAKRIGGREARGEGGEEWTGAQRVSTGQDGPATARAGTGCSLAAVLRGVVRRRAEANPGRFRRRSPIGAAPER